MIDVGRLAALYDEHAAAVYGVALAVTGDVSLACDITEEVFRDAARGEVPVREACLLVETHRRTVTQLRLLGRLPDVAAPPASLASLEEGDRQAVALAYFGGRDYREIARTLGVSAAESAARLHHGLRRLADPTPSDVASVG